MAAFRATFSVSRKTKDLSTIRESLVVVAVIVVGTEEGLKDGPEEPDPCPQ